MSANHTRLKSAINAGERAVKNKIKALEMILFVNICFVSATLILVLLAVFLANLAGLLITLGLGGISVIIQVKNWRETIIIHIQDKNKLEGRIDHVKMRFDLCSPDDERCLKKVEKLLESYFEELIVVSTEKEEKILPTSKKK